jgi:hypothetical protein
MTVIALKAAENQEHNKFYPILLLAGAYPLQSNKAFGCGYFDDFKVGSTILIIPDNISGKSKFTDHNLTRVSCRGFFSI